MNNEISPAQKYIRANREFRTQEFLIYNETLSIEAVKDPEPVINPLDDKYEHFSFTADSRPDLHDYALRIHAEGYVNMQIVQASALTDNGILTGADKEYREDNIEYYLSTNPANLKDAATLRKISLPSGTNHTYLPAYIHTHDSLWEEGLSIIENQPNQVDTLKEISAMSRTKDSSSFSIFETLRDVFKKSIGKGELWFCSLLVPTHETLVKNFGEHCFRLIGNDVMIDDGKANPDMKFRPVIFQPDFCLSNMLDDYRSTEDPKIKNRILRSFMFFNYCISDELKNLEVSSFYHDLYDKLFNNVQNS